MTLINPSQGDENLALKMVKSAVEACRREKKELHGIWTTPASGDDLCKLVSEEHYTDLQQYFEEEGLM